LMISHGTVVQVILSSILPICVCNAMDEAAATAFSSNSGDRTLEYNMICQCKWPSCCGSITPLKAAIQLYARQSY
jgi:hypothetical protein